ncbi:hypothetical protein ACKWTF_011767 [Chironomus riparius]
MTMMRNSHCGWESMIFTVCNKDKDADVDNEKKIQLIKLLCKSLICTLSILLYHHRLNLHCGFPNIAFPALSLCRYSKCLFLLSSQTAKGFYNKFPLSNGK